jgi:hypothetical protein
VISSQPVTCVSGSPATIIAIPPGPSSVTFGVTSGTAFLAAGTAAGTANGIVLTAALPPYTLASSAESRGGTVSLAAAAGTAQALVLFATG